MIRLLYPKFWKSKNYLAYILIPISCIYYLLGYIRRFVIKPYIYSNRKVICVGNATVGGVGKTQIVIYIAKLLKKKKESFVIVTKGYRSNLKTAVIVDNTHTYLDVGDESLELMKYGKVIATKKVKSIIPLIEQLNPNIIIFDDGMQNPSIYADINILVIDGNRKFGNGFLFPAGPLRTLINSAYKISDFIIIIGNNDKFYINHNNVYYASIIPVSNKYLDMKRSYIAFCGIGNPNRFFNLLSNYGINIKMKKIYPDHYQYSFEDISFLKNMANKFNALLITTNKDYVKIYDKIDVIVFSVQISFSNVYNFDNNLYNKLLLK